MEPISARSDRRGHYHIGVIGMRCAGLDSVACRLAASTPTSHDCCAMATKTGRIVILGASGSRGTYVLRLRLSKGLSVQIGRRTAGEPAWFPAGEYAYVGSALGRGTTALSRRLLRHATRSGSCPPHALGEELLGELRTAGMAPGVSAQLAKKLHWHIDYLLQPASVQLIGCTILRSPRRLEPPLAALLEADGDAQVIYPGFGAGDAPGSTHLFRVPATRAWWDRLTGAAAALLEPAIGRSANS